jgi:hypothetical protein
VHGNVRECGSVENRGRNDVPGAASKFMTEKRLGAATAAAAAGSAITGSGVDMGVSLTSGTGVEASVSSGVEKTRVAQARLEIAGVARTTVGAVAERTRAVAIIVSMSICVKDFCRKECDKN